MRLIDAINFRNLGLRKIAFPYLRDLFVGKPAVPMVKPVMMATLNRCIFVIFRNSANPQMIWVYARRIVTFVHDNFPVRYRPDKSLVNVSMRGDALFLSQMVADCDNPISGRIFIANPKPASFSFPYMSLP